MLAIRKELEEYLKTFVGNLPIHLTRPESADHGDYASNVAFLLAKSEKKAPLDVAHALAEKINTSKPDFLEKVEAVSPGFLNFHLKPEVYLDGLQAEKPQITSSLTGKKVMIEFTDPNPFKEFHIGHLYSNIVGESIARLLEATGAEVRRVCYQGDVGLHVAKALWGLQEKLKTEDLDLKTLEERELKERAKFLGEAYALGAKAYEEDSEAKEAIIAINKQIYSKDSEVLEQYEKGRQWSLDYFEEIYKRLGTTFDSYYFESKVGEFGLELVKEYLAKGVFEESQGAVIFPGEKYGLHSRVFINSLGLPTYEAKELGLAPLKHKDFPYDLSIIVTGNEINEYFRVLLKALEQINPELAEKTKHLSHGMVRLPEGKMSSRTGTVVTGEWLLNEAHGRAKTLGKEQQLASEISEMVGIAAVKYALLKGSIGKDVEFSFDESISFDGNSGPYLQYTYVRTRSVLSKEQRAKSKENDQRSTINHQPEVEELQLLKLLSRFDEVVLEAAEKFAPSTLATYLFELAQQFNNFYQKHPILKQEEQVTQFRLGVTAAVGKTMKEGLELLGIQTPEKM